MSKWTACSRVAAAAALMALVFMAPAALSDGDAAPADSPVDPPAEFDWSSFSDAVIAAKDESLAAIARADAAFEADRTAAEQVRDVAIARAEEDVTEEFDKAIRSAERRDKDDLVVALEEAKGYLLNPPAPPQTSPSEAVLGQWLFTFADGTSESFMFYSDGKIVDEGASGTEHKGTWSVDANHVRIRWTDGIWALMRLPLDFGGTVGDDLYGLEAFTAVKLDEDAESEVDWDELSTAARRAKGSYEDDLAEADEEYDDALASAESARRKALNAAIKPLLRELEKALKAAEREDDDAAAADIAEAIRYVETNMGPRGTADVLLGMWETEAARWKFLKNGSVAIEYRTGGTDVGQWRLTDDYVSIVWTAMIPRDDDEPLLRRARVVRQTPRGARRGVGLVPNLDDSLPVPWAVRKRNGAPRWSALRLPLDEAGTTVDSWEGVPDTTITKEDETGQ